MLASFSYCRLFVQNKDNHASFFNLIFFDVQQFFHRSHCSTKNAGVSLITKVSGNCQVTVVLQVPSISFPQRRSPREVRLFCSFEHMTRQLHDVAQFEFLDTREPHTVFRGTRRLLLVWWLLLELTSRQFFVRCLLPKRSIRDSGFASVADLFTRCRWLLTTLTSWVVFSWDSDRVQDDSLPIRARLMLLILVLVLLLYLCGFSPSSAHLLPSQRHTDHPTSPIQSFCSS